MPQMQIKKTIKIEKDPDFATFKELSKALRDAENQVLAAQGDLNRWSINCASASKLRAVSQNLNPVSFNMNYGHIVYSATINAEFDEPDEKQKKPAPAPGRIPKEEALAVNLQSELRSIDSRTLRMILNDSATTEDTRRKIINGLIPSLSGE